MAGNIVSKGQSNKMANRERKEQFDDYATRRFCIDGCSAFLEYAKPGLQPLDPSV